MNSFEDKYGCCGMCYIISVIGGKWKWIILWKIYKSKVIRYNKLKNNLEPIAHKTLSAQLKELENSKLIHREQYNEVPPRVEYSLTEEGMTLIPVLELMSKWGNEHKGQTP
ncbi:MAG: helix-turn-helix transcriptional regulator [Clostridium tyrobutyricum]|jgi:DNA-binding HxlR family transcriptional regulator|uniref:winged helix-turn-helix transcriptional regulator n=1 Tax=Clostridium tyrobutyricum TaxID=1519 RepID=UPI001C38CACA|nr:helix-turn-helix domain-containing protein [Clostridium tyrobutyricum]MBV4426493.1 helix-turn-helix transcriptional regulator [Clostridium tyrobutyricum]MCH4199962.1 helix-turn-helix transcriptional regulator [Clostridium tyrobutyricum]MCH4238172.1 helix-turn-helix transcriptional regulator [Clostridium tyrobutyricum]MCH4259953.1 helix-turn-helix transcriptional regulator [Clostridium tyrobutyricum]MCI1240322.1 helix-turn-helix transcriptional regulator [Clostridium tyrobutyricum]